MLLVAVVLVIGPIGWAGLIFGTPIWILGDNRDAAPLERAASGGRARGGLGSNAVAGFGLSPGKGQANACHPERDKLTPVTRKGTS